MEAYTKKYGTFNAFKKIGEDFKTNEYNEKVFMKKLLDQRKTLAKKVYEPLGFKSYDPCPGFLSSAWQIENPEMSGYTHGLNKTCANERITYYDDRISNTKIMLIPSQYWMIAKVQDLHKILLSDCLDEQIKKSKEIGIQSNASIKQKLEIYTSKLNQLDNLIKSVTLDNFDDKMGQINELVELNKKELSEILVDSDFTKNFTDLITYAKEIKSGNISTNSLTKCLNMVKESEEKEEWILKGGTIMGFYANQASNYKKLYSKYKSKYLQSNKH